MISNIVKPFKLYFQQNYVFYIIGFVIIFAMKYFYSKAGSDALDWILAPTALWVEMISGIVFEKQSGIGYINNPLKFIIAPSCSGVQFMVITFATLLYTFVHRMNTTTKKLCWTEASILFAYLFTIFVNGFRIVLSVHLANSNIEYGWITPERLHMIVGTAIYFVSLFVAYHIASYASKRLSASHGNEASNKPLARTVAPPLFWYLCFTLAIPLLNMAYKNDGYRFIEYTIVMLGVCSTVVILFCLANIFLKYMRTRK